MVVQIIENRIIEYITLLICVLYVLIRIITVSCYAHIVKESKNIDSSRGRFVKRLRENLLQKYEQSGGIQNVSILVKAYMNNMRIAGFKMVFWNKIRKISVLICFSMGITGMFMSYITGQDERIIVEYLFLAVCAPIVVISAGIIFDTRYREQCIYTNICNHFENYVFPALKNGTYDYGIRNLTKLSDEIDANMLELVNGMGESGQAESSGEMVPDKNNTGINLTDNEQEIFEEIINEYLT